MNKAVFFDRDGVINEMVFDRENGIVHTPLLPDQIVFTPGIENLLQQSKDV